MGTLLCIGTLLPLLCDGCSRRIPALMCGSAFTLGFQVLRLAFLSACGAGSPRGTAMPGTLRVGAVVRLRAAPGGLARGLERWQSLQLSPP